MEGPVIATGADRCVGKSRETAARAVPWAILAACACLAGCAPALQNARPGADDPTRKVSRPARGKDLEKRLAGIVKSYLGTPYRRGGMGRSGMDCSGFVCVVFRELDGTKLPRSTRKLKFSGRAVPFAAIRPGDLVLFRGEPYYAINHVGIYLGEKRFAHASSTVGVEINNMTTDYYRRHFAGVRRILP